jgi:hypothetical protein
MADGVADPPAWLGPLQHRLLLVLSIWPGGVSEHETLEEELEQRMNHTKNALFATIREDVEPAEDGTRRAAEVRKALDDIYGLQEQHARCVG